MVRGGGCRGGWQGGEGGEVGGEGGEGAWWAVAGCERMLAAWCGSTRGGGEDFGKAVKAEAKFEGVIEIVVGSLEMLRRCDR